tara:strand:- start:231 stop:860 length:630 start_codon:yes stop_codon:yes gene_type:complete
VARAHIFGPVKYGFGDLVQIRKFSLWQRFLRMLRYRLVIPLKRSRHEPEHTARGVMVGVAWAMTPTVGIQMPIVFANWIVIRKFFGWDFHLVNGLAWTWISNVLTLPPLYYLFFLTGQLLLGRTGDLAGYGVFLSLIDGWQNVSLSDLGTTAGWFGTILTGPGASMMIGCVPWAILSGWISYVWSLAFVRRYRARKAAGRLAKSLSTPR